MAMPMALRKIDADQIIEAKNHRAFPFVLFSAAQVFQLDPPASTKNVWPAMINVHQAEARSPEVMKKPWALQPGPGVTALLAIQYVFRLNPIPCKQSSD